MRVGVRARVRVRVRVRVTGPTRLSCCRPSSIARLVGSIMSSWVGID